MAIPEEMVREILLKLPTRDVARFCCVSTLWRAVVRDPSFRTLHAARRHATSSEVLLVTEKRVPGRSLEAAVFSVSSGKPMCRLGATLDSSISPTNACNGLLCLASTLEGAPAFVCNPVTGGADDMLEVPAPPPPPPSNFDILHYQFALGFSPSTGEYKLFRLSFGETLLRGSEGNCYIDVYTLGSGAGGGWREHPRLFPCRGFYQCPPPTLVDGKLYVLTRSQVDSPTILVIDVATEAHCTYDLPEYDGEHRDVHALEMDGRLCLAVRWLDGGRDTLDVWAMRDAWDLMYVFDMGDVPCYRFPVLPSAAWYDGGAGMLCYRLGDRLYKSSASTLSSGVLLEWDYQFQLPASDNDQQSHWAVYGGYRPSLLSPLVLASSQQDDDDEDDESEQALLGALRLPRHETTATKRHRRSPHRPAAKRICVSKYH